MKKLLSLLLCLAAGISTYAEVNRDLLIGVWKTEWLMAKGGTFVGYTEFTKDGRCLQVAWKKEGGGRWLFIESKWGFGPPLWQEVVRSNDPKMAVGKKSELRLIAVSATELIYESEGRLITEDRATMPDEARQRLNAFLNEKKG